MEAPTGLEPVYRDFAGRCLIQLDDGAIKSMAGADGLEPSKMQESKSCALPTWRCPNIYCAIGKIWKSRIVIKQFRDSWQRKS